MRYSPKEAEIVRLRSGSPEASRLVIAQAVGLSEGHTAQLIFSIERKRPIIEQIEECKKNGNIRLAAQIDLEQGGLGQRASWLIKHIHGIDALLAHTPYELEQMRIKGAGKGTINRVNAYLKAEYGLSLKGT